MVCLLAHGLWFSPGTLASSTTKTGRHDIAESGIKYNYQFHIIWFDLTRVPALDLLHLKREW
jgi:hypothetical protein